MYINENLSSGAVKEFITALPLKGKTDIHSVIMYKNNELMLSLSPQPYSTDFSRQVYSVSKTLSATAIGILYDMGLVNPDDKLCDIFKDKLPENPSDYLMQLTVWHLLTMTVGHKVCSMKSIAESDDGVREFLNAEIVHKPGTNYLYDTGASYMLSAVVTQLTSLSLFDFLYIHLFTPLEISPTAWPFSGGKANEGGLGLRISGEDYSKIALMYLNGGMYNGKRILSEDWVNQSFYPHSTGDINRTVDWRCGYGYQFWNCDRGGYRADGAFGQYVIIDRKRNIVLLLFGESQDVETELDLCFDFIDSAFSEDNERETNIELIKEKLASFYIPLSSDKIHIPVTCYLLEENVNDFTLLNLSCNGDILRLAFSDGQAVQTINAGNGKWLFNAFFAKRFVPQLYSLVPENRRDYGEFFASFEITNDGEITLLIKFTNNPHTCVMKISFADTLSVEMNKTVSPAKQEAFILTGKKA